MVRPIRVLHVTEAMGGGVETALIEYVLSTPEFEHHLAFAVRGSWGTGDRDDGIFQSVTDLGFGPRNLFRGCRTAVNRIKPDVVHLHSGWAGLLGRLSLRSSNVRVVYSPHSYFFSEPICPPLSAEQPTPWNAFWRGGLILLLGSVRTRFRWPSV